MRIVSFLDDTRPGWGIQHGERILAAPATAPADLLGLLALAPTEQQAWLARISREGRPLNLDALTLTAPIPRPRKNLICLGLNYLAHAQESFAAKGKAVELGEHPVVFSKAVSTVNGPEADVVLDPRVTSQLDWEAELAVVIGSGGRFIAETEALQHVFGYTVANDLSARDVQFRHKQYFLGKSVDGCCPLGPAIVTPDEIGDAQDLEVICRVNGVEKQRGHTSQQQFGVARTIAILSTVMTLEAGDIILTGTPEGVGFARKPPEYLAVGDLVECEVPGIGCLRNRIVAPQ